MSITISFGTNSDGTASILSPRKSLNCPKNNVTAIPHVKPVVMVYGINLIKEPNGIIHDNKMILL